MASSDVPPPSGLTSRICRRGIEAVFQADQPRAFTQLGSANSVVAHRDVQPGTSRVCAYRHLRGLGVLGGVGQRLGHHIVRGDLDGVG